MTPNRVSPGETPGAKLAGSRAARSTMGAAGLLSKRRSASLTTKERSIDSGSRQHNRERFAAAALALTKSIHRGIRPGIAGELKSAESFDCKNLAGFKHRNRFTDRKRKLRSANRTGNGLGMKSSIREIAV